MRYWFRGKQVYGNKANEQTGELRNRLTYINGHLIYARGSIAVNWGKKELANCLYVGKIKPDSFLHKQKSNADQL